MSKKKTHEEYVAELAIKNPNITVLEEYIDAKTPISHQCNLDQYIWKAKPNNILNGTGCPVCANNLKKTTEQYIQELAKVNPNIVVRGEYVGANIPILHECLIDQYQWMAQPDNVLHGKGCSMCKIRKLSEAHYKSHDEYVQELAEYNPDIEVLEQYVGANIPILHRCKRDLCEWMACPNDILHGRGCPQCQESSGERVIRQWLELKRIQYAYQKRFPDCKDVNVLPFDFYILDYNTCIEFDGPQHFEPIDFAGKGKEWAQQQFEKTQYHDKIKNKYCEDNNIRLLRIPYFKNIEEELNNFLFI